MNPADEIATEPRTPWPRIEREDRGAQPGDDRQARQLCVRHPLRDQERGDDEAGDEVLCTEVRADVPEAGARPGVAAGKCVRREVLLLLTPALLPVGSMLAAARRPARTSPQRASTSYFWCPGIRPAWS